MNSDRVLLEQYVIDFIKDKREKSGLMYWEINERLRKGGIHLTDQSLINKINRGGYTFAFAIQFLHAMDVKSIDIPTPKQIESMQRKQKK